MPLPRAVRVDKKTQQNSCKFHQAPIGIDCLEGFLKFLVKRRDVWLNNQTSSTQKNRSLTNS